MFRLAKRIPFVAKKIDAELKKIENDFLKDVISRNKDIPYIIELPKSGMSDDEVLGLVDMYLQRGKSFEI